MARKKVRVIDAGAHHWSWPNNSEHIEFLVKEIKGVLNGKVRYVSGATQPGTLSLFACRDTPALKVYHLKARFFNHIIGPVLDFERVVRAGLEMPNQTPQFPYVAQD